MPEEPSSEKRTTERVPMRLEVNFQSVDSFLSEYTMNISRGGMFVSTRNPLEVGTRLSLQFTLPETQIPIKIHGEVVWATTYEKSSNLIPGMGIRFRELNSEDRATLEDFIEKLRVQSG